MIFDLTAKKLISYDSEKSPENLRENFVAFMKGLISFPLNIPGTAYHKCLQVYQSIPLLPLIIRNIHLLSSYASKKAKNEFN